MKRTLKKGYQFRIVFRTGRKFRGSTFRAFYRKNTLGFVRLGFSISAKSGNAVKRNLMRRRMRELASSANLGIDIVILPVGKIVGIGWKEMKDDFHRLLAEAKETVTEK